MNEREDLQESCHWDNLMMMNEYDLVVAGL